MLVRPGRACRRAGFVTDQRAASVGRCDEEVRFIARIAGTATISSENAHSFQLAGAATLTRVDRARLARRRARGAGDRMMHAVPCALRPPCVDAHRDCDSFKNVRSNLRTYVCVGRHPLVSAGSNVYLRSRAARPVARSILASLLAPSSARSSFPVVRAHSVRASLERLHRVRTRSTARSCLYHPLHDESFNGTCAVPGS